MVLRKIKLQRNVLKIVTAVRFLSYQDCILPYISIKFRPVVAKLSSYTVVKTARKPQQLNLDLWLLIAGKSQPSTLYLKYMTVTTAITHR